MTCQHAKQTTSPKGITSHPLTVRDTKRGQAVTQAAICQQFHPEGERRCGRIDRIAVFQVSRGGGGGLRRRLRRALWGRCWWCWRIHWLLNSKQLEKLSWHQRNQIRQWTSFLLVSYTLNYGLNTMNKHDTGEITIWTNNKLTWHGHCTIEVRSTDRI